MDIEIQQNDKPVGSGMVGAITGMITNKRKSKRKNFGQIMSAMFTLKDELVTLTKEKDGHIARLDRDIKRLDEERVSAKDERISALGTIQFIENMSNAQPVSETFPEN